MLPTLYFICNRIVNFYKDTLKCIIMQTCASEPDATIFLCDKV